MSDAQPAFALDDMQGNRAAFPSGKPAVVCFLKEDCPTCNEVMTVLESFYRAYGDDIDILLAGQTVEGNRTLIDRHGLTVPLLDDSALKVAWTWDVDIVPTIYLTGGDGAPVERREGFVREEWLTFDAAIAAAAGSEPAPIEWESLPAWRPGCGSLTGDPDVAARLAAEDENSPIRARRIEVAEQDDEFEFMFDQGFTDGLPVIPPTAERVLRMLTGTNRDAQEVVATMPPNMAPATVEKIAINAVMAGCKPEYLPVVIAAVEAACTDEFNIHGVMATTMGASPVMVVNGPIRERLGMNMRLGALGQGTRANVTIGRALRLAVRNIGGARPGGTERSTLGNPMKIAMCFPEFEERSPWEPLHVERGFDAADSVVTLFAMTSGPTLIVDQTSLTGPQMAGSIGQALNAAHHPKAHPNGDCLLVVCPEHVDTLGKGDPIDSKAKLRSRIQEVTAVPMASLVQDEDSGVGIPAERLEAMTPEQRATRVPKFASDANIHIVVAGADAGKFSGAFHGWATGPMGSISVSRKIEEL
ncbi:MAG: thiol-disulfide oxidoreductase [Gammaproteobacteria bacterium]|nr:thiol-disulfide oxidoreductase [Gammaproteobacteria bacterium]|tara:strand:+ start:4054 stop:5643 length:1590 start_codon:yes stop_codon:yes gene_type:complete